MDVNAVGPSANSAVRFSYTEHAQRLAEANKAARLDVPSAAVTEPAARAANVPTSATYSPQLYAQAAHFQVLAQAGAFAAAQGAQPTPPPKVDDGGIPKVDAVDGASIGSVD